MANNKSFEDRLKQAGHDTTKTTPEFSAPTPRRPAQRGLSINLMLIAVIVVAALGAGYSILQYTNRPNPMAALASPYLAGETPPKLNGPKGIYAFEAPENVYQQSCLPFLPDAPADWVRVTAWDARYPAVLEKLDGVWNAAGKSLNTTPGFSDLSEFIDRYSGPLAFKTNAVGQGTLSSAMYFNVRDDSYFLLDMKSSSWRESNSCKEEFLYQWASYDPNKPKRYPVLTQFSFTTMGDSANGVSAAMRKQGKRFHRAHVRVSAGLEIAVKGIVHSSDVRRVLNGEDINLKVASVSASIEE